MSLASDIVAGRSPNAVVTQAGIQLACLALPSSPPQAVQPFMPEEPGSPATAIFTTMSLAWTADKTVPIPTNRARIVMINRWRIRALIVFAIWLSGLADARGFEAVTLEKTRLGVAY